MAEVKSSQLRTMFRKYGNVFSPHVAQAGGLRLGRLSAGYQPAPPVLARPEAGRLFADSLAGIRRRNSERKY